jgi:hypothetical protein
MTFVGGVSKKLRALVIVPALDVLSKPVVELFLTNMCTWGLLDQELGVDVEEMDCRHNGQLPQL